MTRIMDALAARMDRIRKGDKGFTLIELLVVVIIIGILAAIAIPVYIGVQNNARNSATQSDLGNAKTAVIAYFTSNPASTSTPALTTAALGTYGLTLSDDTLQTAADKPSYVVAGSYVSPTKSSDPFCIKATSKGGGVFYVTSDKGVSNVACS